MSELVTYLNDALKEIESDNRLLSIERDKELFTFHFQSSEDLQDILDTLSAGFPKDPGVLTLNMEDKAISYIGDARHFLIGISGLSWLLPFSMNEAAKAFSQAGLKKAGDLIPDYRKYSSTRGNIEPVTHIGRVEYSQESLSLDGFKLDDAYAMQKRLGERLNIHAEIYYSHKGMTGEDYYNVCIDGVASIQKILDEVGKSNDPFQPDAKLDKSIIMELKKFYKELQPSTDKTR